MSHTPPSKLFVGSCLRLISRKDDGGDGNLDELSQAWRSRADHLGNDPFSVQSSAIAPSATCVTWIEKGSSVVVAMPSVAVIVMLS